MRNAWLVLLAVALVGCPKSQDKSADEKEKSADEGKAAGKKKKGDDDDKSKKGDDDAPKKKGDDDSAEAPTKKKKDVAPPERTKTPTIAEWNAAKDVDADDNDANCEVRSVREWVRVSCRKKSPGGGDPTAVAVTSGKTKETFTFSGKGVESIVTPLLPGTRLLAKYSWSDVVYALRIEWPQGEERPAVFAHFAKTDDPPTKPVGLAMCECYKKAPYKGKCVDGDEGWSITSQNPFCEASYASDCEKMVACGRGEPGAMPTCPKGRVLVYPGNACAVECKKDADCAKGETCQDLPSGNGKKGCTE